MEQFPYMKRYILVAAIGLLTTAGVTATVLSGKNKKTTKETSKDCSTYKSKCSKASKTTCY